MPKTQVRGSWAEGYARGRAHTAKRIQNRHLKRALRKYKTGDLHTMVTEPEVWMLQEAGWVVEQIVTRAMSTRYYMRLDRSKIA